MKLVFSILLAGVFIFSNSINTIRTTYFSDSKDEVAAAEFIHLMESINTDTPVLKAYKGASMALKAKYNRNSKEKRRYFEQAVHHIEAAVQAEPNNPEIRLIRLSIQENSPRIVKYNTNLDEDKVLILSSYDRQPEVVKKCIRAYVSHSNVFSEEEKSSILD